ncbi:dexh-box atp-dependent rna helicase dexh1 [Quercus suber]|uniref:RNA helicase n=1 Tax=Quercus suber TaxID=58331 RepID=A0AAW0K1I4_QUESU
MSLRSFGANYSYCYHCCHCLSSHISFARRFSSSQLRISARAMSYRPNFQGGRRGGSPNSRGRGGARRGGGGGGGGRGGGRGEQRWWDPVWRAERLRQQQAEMEVLDENEWWGKIEQMKGGGEQEMIIKRNFSRADQQTLYDMAYQLGLYFHAYNKGKTLVVSKVPLPDYRADLDERHGSTQKEIRMSTEIERRVGNLLNSSESQGTLTSIDSSVAPSQGGKGKPSSSGVNIIKPDSLSDIDSAKDNLSLELKQRQEKMKVSDSSRAMRSFREKLPAFKMKSEFLKVVAENQVLVVSGETGCGKTTQLPQFILENKISCLRGADCRIMCTQPRRISAISVAARIASERGESLGETVGYQIRLEAKRSAQTRLLFCTTGVLLRQLVQDPKLAGVSHLLVDEIHERGMNEDFLLIILRDLLPRRPDLRLILMSATINADLFSKYFGNAPTIHIPDADIDSQYKNYSVSTRKSLEAWSGSQLDLGLLLDKVKANNFLGDPSKFLVLPLHGKIVLATNIAESSITIDDVVYVIDCGKAKETSYDALNKLACLLPSWISKASAHQRRGRAGRVQPGVCYRLYPKMIHDAMLQYQLPEILRTPLQELCLHIKSLQLGTIGSFLAKALQPPDALAVQNAIELLKTIGALDDMEELTPLGRHLCTLPLDPNIGKMLLMGSIFQCLNPALTIAAALAHRDPFVLPINRKEEADEAKRSFAGDSCSHDLEMVSAILCAGLYPNVVQCKRRGKRTAFYTKEVGKVDIHPSSVNAGVHLFPLPYMVYSEKVKTTSIYVRDSTNISDYALLLFGGNLIPSKTGEGIEMLGGYLHFSASKSVLELIRKLRTELDKLLNRKIEEPGLDISMEGKGVVAAAVELLHSQTIHY